MRCNSLSMKSNSMPVSPRTDSLDRFLHNGRSEEQDVKRYMSNTSLSIHRMRKNKSRNCQDMLRRHERRRVDMCRKDTWIRKIRWALRGVQYRRKSDRWLMKTRRLNTLKCHMLSPGRGVSPCLVAVRSQRGLTLTSPI